MRHDNANNMTPHLLLSRHLQIFEKIDSVLKNVSNVLYSEKVDCILEEPLRLHIIVD